MGLLEPWHIIVLLLFFGVPFGLVCYFVAIKRYIGGTAGFFLGFFLGPVGLIVVLCSNKKEPAFPFFPFESIHDQLKKYKDLLDSGAITEAEYNLQKSRLLNSSPKM
jgi:hypothetical protein